MEAWFGLSKAHTRIRQQLPNQVRIVFFKPGHVIYSLGDMPSQVVCLLDGSVETVSEHKASALMVASLASVHTVGLEQVIQHIRMPFTYVAKSEVTSLVVGSHFYQQAFGGLTFKIKQQEAARTAGGLNAQHRILSHIAATRETLKTETPSKFLE